jgi:Flp pilus assembly protein CpaB
VSLATVLQDVSRTARRHRAVLAAGLTAAAVATALPTLAPPAARTLRVVAAAHDLTPGTPLTADDLTTVAVPEGLVPRGALTDVQAAVGRAVAGPVRGGEALTDVRLLGSGLLQGKGLVAAPIRLADPATAALLHAGDRVDVLAAPTGGTDPTATALIIASGVQVLAVPATDDTGEGALVVVAATPAVAARLAAAAVGARLSVTVLAS